MQQISIRKGRVIVYRIFDIAEEIDLAKVESAVRTPGTTRLSLARSTGHALVVRNAPVTLSLGNAPVRVGPQEFDAEMFVRVWDYGVMSVQFHIAIAQGTTWDELVRLAAAAEDDNNCDAVARVRGTELLSVLRPALVEPHEPHGLEDYVVYLLEEIDGIASVSQLADSVDIPALILGEPSTKLSPRVKKPILESTFQYSTGDLAVIDWNSALVVEPGGSRDVADMLEFAATHLTEFRYFDELLDIKLDQLYDAIDAKRVTGLFRRDYAALSRDAGSLYVEFSEFVERVENSLKFVGDFYLATIFRAAVTRFNLHEWEENVSRKMNVLTNVSEVLKNEVDVSRSHWLEIIVIALIVFEILSAILRVA